MTQVAWLPAAGAIALAVAAIIELARRTKHGEAITVEEDEGARVEFGGGAAVTIIVAFHRRGSEA